ncbi:MAG TPA: peptidoglycan-binding domain-containing protein [Gaiellaceae bacterium]|nr:peptidoglycan-binding domain-containing protein [Gaiellaceae bacterium]
MSETEDTLVSAPQRLTPPAPRRLQLSRRSLIALGAGVAVVVAVVIAFASGAFGGGSAAPGSADNPYPTSLQTVTRQSLTQQTQVSATLGYADPATIVAPAGTTPQDLAQAKQAATTAQTQLQTAQAALTADKATLDQANASLSADRAKLAVDCGGDNAGESAASPSASGSGNGSGSGACATDSQSVSADRQSVTQAAAKVASDQQATTSATTALATAAASLTQAESSGTVYGQSSTYTELPAVGAIVKRGQTLYEISGAPVVVLYGSVAPWRAFMSGMSPGQDVAELNSNLRALGYGSGLSGDAFTSETVSAIDAFQSARGLSQTGQLLLGSVVFEPGPVRVTTVTPTLGATVQAGPVLGITSLVRQVTIALDAAQQSDLKVGDPVTITLPDNSTTPGKVSYVGTVATVPSSSDQGGGGSSSPTIEVDVTPTDPAATGHLDQAPVNVSITTGSVQNALTVPVNALLALASGGYAVEVAGAGGVHHLVGVQLGLFDDANGLVQVTGTSLTVGTRVVVPST